MKFLKNKKNISKYILIFFVLFSFSCRKDTDKKHVTYDKEKAYKNIDKNARVFFGNSKNHISLKTKKEQSFALILTNMLNHDVLEPNIKIDGHDIYSVSRLEEKVFTGTSQVKHKDTNLKVSFDKTKRINSIHKMTKIGLEENFYCVEDNRISSRKFVNMYDEIVGGQVVEFWVDTNSYLKKEPQIINDFGNKFLDSKGSGIDIFSRVEDVFGIHWGDHDNDNYIDGSKNHIKIFFYDIDSDGPDFSENKGKILGYFSYVLLQKEHNNGGISIFIDSALVKKQEKESLGTLAHEFQHVINFYQNDILKNHPPEVWLNEGLSMFAEDLVSDLLYTKSPRGVDQQVGKPYNYTAYSGNFLKMNIDNGINARPLHFILNPNTSQDKWEENGDSYSINYLFIFYLVRNFGGVKLIHNIMNSNKKSSIDVVSDALQRSGYADDNYYSALRKWAIANMLSNDAQKNPGYDTNNGGFFEIKNDSRSYKLGSLDLTSYVFNKNVNNKLTQISKIPFCFANICQKISKLAEHSNTYYKIQINKDVKIDISVIPEEVGVSVVKIN